MDFKAPRIYIVSVNPILSKYCVLNISENLVNQTSQSIRFYLITVWMPALLVETKPSLSQSDSI